MSRRPRDEAAAALAVRELERALPRGPVLVLEDPRPDVAAAVEGAGVSVETWSRLCGDPAGPPGDAGFDRVALRLPRSRAESEMLLTLAGAALPPGGGLLVYGANDEGIRSVPGRLPPLFTPGVTLATGGHARLVGSERTSLPAPSGGIESFRVENPVVLPWGERRWTSWPGVFAGGRLDEGTALLLAHLPPVPDGARVLDYGCGTGFLAAGVLQAAPGAGVVGVDPDVLAVRAARLNAPEAEMVVGWGWSAVEGRGPWDVVVSNPPYHRGKEETLSEIDAFLGGLSEGLAPGHGVMRCVVQRRLPLAERARAAGLPEPRAVADTGPYRVWEVLASH